MTKVADPLQFDSTKTPAWAAKSDPFGDGERDEDPAAEWEVGRWKRALKVDVSPIVGREARDALRCAAGPRAEGSRGGGAPGRLRSALSKTPEQRPGALRLRRAADEALRRKSLCHAMKRLGVAAGPQGACLSSKHLGILRKLQPFLSVSGICGTLNLDSCVHREAITRNRRP
ncbi:MAG: hypothetical protein JNJ88_06785 [Planctomycetes bacterium]|nr:hypothetical protein [Planctomycetota bacterium]